MHPRSSPNSSWLLSYSVLSAYCLVGDKDETKAGTGKDGDLGEGSSKETTNEPMNANIQEEEYGAACASQGRQVGPCGSADPVATLSPLCPTRLMRAHVACGDIRPGTSWSHISCWYERTTRCM